MTDDIHFGQMAFGGLGYTSSQANSDEPESLFVKNLMQQCLAYHEEQQHPKPSQQEDAIPPIDRAIDSQSNSYSNSRTTNRDVPQTVVIPTGTTIKDPPQSQGMRPGVEEGRLRAGKILEKFQQLTRQHGGSIEAKDLTASEFRAKREKCFDKEDKRKREFWIKNFDYVARRDSQRLQQQMAQLHEAKEWENQVQDQYRHVLEQRRRRLLRGNNKNLTTQAGIGTAKRRKVEKEKDRTGHNPMSAKQQDSSVAVYLSGLPVDGSVADSTLNELFSSYGTIRKIHYYRHKQTGELKGDALVIYQLDKSDERDLLLQTVCPQMNGVELPCGSILRVEPADSGYQEKASKYGPQETLPANEAKNNCTTNQAGSGEAGDDKGDEGSTGDLDDFFESLE